MESSISVAIADIILNLLLDYVESKLNFKYKLLKKYVDNLIMVFQKTSVNEILNIFKSFDNKIQFTYDEETDGKIAY